MTKQLQLNERDIVLAQTAHSYRLWHRLSRNLPAVAADPETVMAGAEWLQRQLGGQVNVYAIADVCGMDTATVVAKFNGNWDGAQYLKE